MDSKSSRVSRKISYSFLKILFNALYPKTDGDVVDDRKITEQEVGLFSRILNLSPENKVLDLACGQGRHTLQLATMGFQNVQGLDRSHYLIQRARATAKKEGLNVKFREGDARKTPYPADAFDVVLIPGNSFGYFETKEEDLRVLMISSSRRSGTWRATTLSTLATTILCCRI